MSSPHVTALILAAGKGTRMKSDLPKVLHNVYFAPMIHHVLDFLQPLDLSKTVVVTGHKKEMVEESLVSYGTTFAFQEKQLGTGHAVLAAEDYIKKEKTTVLILCGDTPLLRTSTLTAMIEQHSKDNAVLTVMSTVRDNPTNYGRMVTDEMGNLLEIVEEKDASAVQRQINEVNAGVYCVDSEFLLQALQQLDTNNSQGEMYLTDIVSIAHGQSLAVKKFRCADALEILGVNSRQELSQAHDILQNRRLQQHMADGVTIIQPDTVTIEQSVTIAADTVISPHCYLSGKSVIASGVTVEPFCMLHDCQVGSGATIGAYSHLHGTSVEPEMKLPAHHIDIKQ